MTVVAARSPAKAWPASGSFFRIPVDVHEVQASRHAVVQIHASHEHLVAVFRHLDGIGLEGETADSARLSADVLRQGAARRLPRQAFPREPVVHRVVEATPGIVVIVHVGLAGGHDDAPVPQFNPAHGPDALRGESAPGLFPGSSRVAGDPHAASRRPGNPEVGIRRMNRQRCDASGDAEWAEALPAMIGVDLGSVPTAPEFLKLERRGVAQRERNALGEKLALLAHVASRERTGPDFAHGGSSRVNLRVQA